MTNSQKIEKIGKGTVIMRILRSWAGAASAAKSLFRGRATIRG